MAGPEPSETEKGGRRELQKMSFGAGAMELETLDSVDKGNFD